MCKVLDVARSSVYAYANKERVDVWAELRAEIERLWLKSKRRWGARTIWSQLSGPFEGTTLYRVRKCMRELGIRGICPRAKKRTTIPDPNAKSRPDLIRRHFDAAVPTTKLVGDITYLKTGQGWLYMATVIDLCTRMVVGLSFSEHMTADLVISALETAWGRGYVAENAIFHSDRGSQYTSKALAEWACSHSVRLSVGRTGSCHDNAVAESFFGKFKTEMYYQQDFATKEQARIASIEYVEVYYNRVRPHSAIGGEIPKEKMDAFFARLDAALAEEGSKMPLVA